MTSRRQYALLGLILVLGALAHLPLLRAPRLLDDYAQSAMVDGRILPQRSAFDLYAYIDDSDRPTLVERGAIPWWTSPHLVVRFFRPLSSVLIWTDHRLFGSGSLWPHVHSLVWWMLAVVGAYSLLSRAVSPDAALLGTAVFAIAPCHADPLLWLANRDVLVSVAVGSWALAWYVAWRDHRRPRDAVVAGLAFGAAWLAGEYTAGFAGYVLAIEATRRREPVVDRLVGLAPYGIPTGAYVLVYSVLHYGSGGTGFYRSPLSDFGAYVSGAPKRFVALFADAWLGLGDTVWADATPGATLAVGAGAIVFAGLLSGLLLQRLAPRERASATWMLGGSILALLPFLAAEPAVRLLAVSTVGLSAIAGLALEHAFVFRPGTNRAANLVLALGTVALAYVQFVQANLSTRAAGRRYMEAVGAAENGLHWVREHIDPKKSTVLVLRAASPPAVFWTPFELGGAAPPRWRVLAFRSGLMLAIRRGPRTLELVAKQNPLFPVGPSDLFRDEGELHEGDAVDLPGMRATILEMQDNQPKRVQFDFDDDLDGPWVQVFAERQTGFEEVRMPAIDTGVRLVP